MLLKRVTSFFVMFAASLAFQLCTTGAAAQQFSRAKVNSVNPRMHTVPAPKSPRPLTPAEKMFTSLHKRSKPSQLKPGLATSSTQIFKSAITSLSGGRETYNAATGDLNGDGKLDLVTSNQCAVNNCSNGVVAVLLGNGDGSYQTPVTYATASGTQFVALGDVNGDGKLDIVTVSYCNSDCSSGATNVLLGNGDGTFQPAVQYDTGSTSSKAVVVSDVNGDGKADLLIVQQCLNNSCANSGLSVLLGNGDGTFQTAVVYTATGTSGQAIATADFNGDGKLDVAILNNCNNNSDCSNGNVSLLFGNGDGTFQTAIASGSMGYGSNGLAVGDVNGDGHADLVVSNQCTSNSDCNNGTVGVALGNGDGTFQTTIQYSSGGLYAQSVAVGDLNSDGKLDIVATNECQSNSGCQNGNSTSVLLGNGDGTFQLSASYAAGESDFDEIEGPAYTTVIMADTNGDGKLDVLVTNTCSGADFECGTGAVNVLLGYGDGTLQGGIVYPTSGSNGYGIAAADLNGDGKPDLLVADVCNSDCSVGAVSVLFNNGDGTFQSGSTFASGGQYSLSVAPGDLNGDGYADAVLLNQCASGCSTSSVSVLLGNGDGTFQSQTSYNLTSSSGQSVLLADVNGDGKLDIIAILQCADNNCSSGAADVLLGNGDGTFQSAVSYSSSAVYALGGSVGDINGDGKADLVIVSECNNNNSCSNGVASVLLGNGDGTFQPAVNYTTVGSSATSVQLADVNGDGKLDIIAQNQCSSNSDCSTGSVVTLLGNGDGTFQAGVSTAMNSQVFFSQSLVVADFNGDHKLDIAFGGADTFLLGNGDGTFQAPRFLGASGSGSVAADFNGDGRPDLAIGGVTILLNISDGFKTLTTTALNSSSNPSSFGQSVTFTATVIPQVPGNPTGTVTFTDGETQLGQVTLADGPATYTTSALAIGSHSITASYSGDSSYATSSSTVFSQVVAIASTTTTLSGTPNPANVGQSITFTATVTPSSSGAPTGTVSFYDGETLLGSGSLTAGVATYSTSSLSAATHSISAVYSGDDNYSGSSSSSLSEVVSAQGFTLSSTALSAATIAAGGSAQWTITVNPVGGLDPTTVNLSCAVAPVVTPAVACSLTPITVSSGVGSATLHVTTAAPHTADQKHLAKQTPGSGKPFLLALFVPCLVFGLAGVGKSNRRHLLGLAITLSILSGCIFQTACGGASTSGTQVPGTPSGAYTVTVTGTAGNMQQTATANLTVQ